MTVRYEDVRRLVQPGSVYSMDDLIRTLSGVLSDAQLTAVATALAAANREELYPGGLITSDFLRRILLDLADLRDRVVKLEGQGIVVSGKVRIDRVTPNNTVLTVGDTLTIEGANFEYSLGTAGVFIGGKKATDFHGGSSDTVLIVTIPDPGSLAEAGTSVKLVVSNHGSSDQTSITVRPKPVPLTGSVVITPGAIKPDPLKSGKPAWFEYRLTSAATKAADFKLLVRLAGDGEAFDPPQYDGYVSLLDDSGATMTKPSINLTPGQPRSLAVALGKLPFDTGKGFSIQVACEADGAGGASPVKTYVIGAGSNDDDFLVVNLGAVDPAASLVSGEICLKAGGTGTAFASVTVMLSDKAAQAGVTSADYKVTQKLAVGSDWAGYLSNDGGTVNAGAPAGIDIEIAAGANASAQARIDLTITRQGQPAGAVKTKQYGIQLKRL